MRRTRARALVMGVGAAMAVGLPSLLSAPLSLADVARQHALTCETGLPTADGRVFPEPLVYPQLVSFEHFVCGMVELEGNWPELLESEVLGQSEGGNDQYVIRMTDESVTSPKQDLLVYSSIHGDEVGAREGATRQIEDMVDPDHLAGEDWVQQVLDEFVIHWFFPNPDGWHNCEGSGICTRGNTNGTDLNRNYPITGYIAGTPLSEVESQQAHDYIMERAGNWSLGTDNHGQFHDTYAAAGLQIVGEFDYQKSETLARFADAISQEMASSNAILLALDTINTVSGLDMGPYHWGTLYDMLGYSASGSMIDWFNTPGGAEGVGFATELTIGRGVRQDLQPTVLNQLHVDSIRAINATMFKQAIDPVQFTYEVGGDVAYVFDPRRITDTDENGRGYDGNRAGSYDEEPYDVSRMQFFEDLNLYASKPLTQIRVPDVLAGTVDLDAFDTVLIANAGMPESWVRHDTAGNPLPEGPEVAIPADEAWYAALKEFIEAGGNLVLTDAALADALPALDIVSAGDIWMDLEYVGSVARFPDTSHPLNQGLRGVASQTYDTVPLGMAFGNPDSAPNWKIDRAAWDAAGGVTAGEGVPPGGLSNPNNPTAALDPQPVVYGELSVGEGRVRVLGALLPDPTEEFFHPFGLQNYAVTYTGYTLLQNMLVWDNPAQVAGEVVEAPAPAPALAPAPAPAPLPATGGGLTLAALGVLGVGAWLRRRS